LVFKFPAIDRWKGAWGDWGRKDREEGYEKHGFLFTVLETRIFHSMFLIDYIHTIFRNREFNIQTHLLEARLSGLE